MFSVPMLVTLPLLSEPLIVNEPALLAVAESKLVADALPAMMLNVPPLTTANEVVPAFSVNEPETTFAMVLLPVPLSVNEPPLSEPLNVATPPTLTVPSVNALVSARVWPTTVVPVPYKLPMLNVPVPELKVKEPEFPTVSKVPAVVVNDAELKVAEPPEATVSSTPVSNNVLTFNVPEFTFTYPPKPVRVPFKVTKPVAMFSVPPPAVVS